jgi:hypothetical protein
MVPAAGSIVVVMTEFWVTPTGPRSGSTAYKRYDPAMARRRMVVVLLDEVLPLDYAIPLHVFARGASEAYDVVTASLDGRPGRSRAGPWSSPTGDSICCATQGLVGQGQAYADVDQGLQVDACLELADRAIVRPKDGVEVTVRVGKGGEEEVGVKAFLLGVEVGWARIARTCCQRRTPRPTNAPGMTPAPPVNEPAATPVAAPAIAPPVDPATRASLVSAARTARAHGSADHEAAGRASGSASTARAWSISSTDDSPANTFWTRATDSRTDPFASGSGGVR